MVVVPLLEGICGANVVGCCVDGGSGGAVYDGPLKALAVEGTVDLYPAIAELRCICVCLWLQDFGVVVCNNCFHVW